MMKSISLIFLIISTFWFAGDSPVSKAKPFVRTIDIRIEQNLMFTDVTIDGEVYNFLIDTGAPFVLSPKLAKKLDFRTSQTMTMGSSNAKKGKARVGTMKRDVEVGGLKFSNFKATVLDYNSNTQVIRCLAFDGIIGANFMSGAIWQIDYDRKKITITNSLKRLSGIDSSWSVKMETRGFNKSPYIPVKVNRGEAGRVLFDTGFAGFFDLTYNSYNKALKADKLDDRIRILEGRGTMSEGAFGALDTTGYFMQVPQIIIGREKVQKPEFRMAHTRKAKVGAEYLKGRLVTLDFPRKRFYVSEKEEKYSPINKKSFLFAATLDDGTMKVSSVYGKLQQSQDLKIGDELLAINGQLLSEIGECDALIFVREQLALDKSLEISAKRGSREFNLLIHKSLIFN
ncbi:MAG: clan AA aspartic protease [Roseivirga sp.]|nr:clan AA aspartic protease [Roseivirga sp.]